MRRALTLAGAGAIALTALAGTVMATPIPDLATQMCADQIQLRTRNYVNSVQTRIRNSLRSNVRGFDSRCSAGLACAGGLNHGDPCVSNAGCALGQCNVKVAPPGINGHIANAKHLLRSRIQQFCDSAQLLTLYGVNGTSLCPDPDSPDNGLDPDEIADCILAGLTGDIAGAEVNSSVGDILARGASEIVPDTISPVGVCSVNLGTLRQMGSASSFPTVSESGEAEPLLITGCGASVCTTEGQVEIGNDLGAPVQTHAGLIPICLVTITGNAGNGTSESGVIHIGGASVGMQTSSRRIATTVLIGTTCPICDAGVCLSGANAGLPCNNKGTTDISCPPIIAGLPPIISNPLDLDTEVTSLLVPPNNPGGGSFNPAQTFCGACDLDNTIGCQNDSDCVTNAVCSGGIGSGCCQFGFNVGAFGVSSATSATAVGRRGPYLPKLAGIYCHGRTGDGLVDASVGFPGPVRVVEERLNAFTW